MSRRDPMLAGGVGRYTSPPGACAQAIALSDERETWERRWRAAGREGYEAGYRDGIAAGRRAAADEEAAQRREAAGLVTGARPGSRYTSNAEAEQRRWAVRGERRTRETFGQPHPADYPGQGAA